MEVGEVVAADVGNDDGCGCDPPFRALLLVQTDHTTHGQQLHHRGAP